jgi:endonuclease YncB( thermonuclease family)
MTRLAGPAALLSAALLLSAPLPLSAEATEGDAAGSSRRLPDLPVIEVKPRPAHTVNDDALPPPARRELDIRRSPDGAAATRTAAASPRAAATAARHVSGLAQPTGATALQVAGAKLRLFGIRPPESRDRCAASAAGAACAERARALLAARTKGGGAVACDAPGRPGAAICRDAQGVDLGGFLVSEGLALADPRESYDYVRAEESARVAKRGLWLYR